MRSLLLWLALYGVMHAGVYYAKVEPAQTVTYKASYAGIVAFGLQEIEGKHAQGEVVLKLDDALEKSDLEHAKLKKSALEQTRALIKHSLDNTREIVRLKELQYNRIKDLKTKSVIEKEAELSALLNLKNQAFAQEQSLQTANIQLADLNAHIALLNDKITKKSIMVPKGHLVYAIHLKKGEYATVGTPLVEAHDLSYGKLTLFVLAEDLPLAQKGVIYIDGLKSDAKVASLWPVADTQHISAYRCEIHLPLVEIFSVLKKIEFKEH